jgi:signal transduction histidine kinase
MARFWGTVAFRLALGYGLLAIGSMSVISAAFYFGTVGVLSRSTDAKIISISNRLADHYKLRGDEGLRQEIRQLLADGIEQDTEVYPLVGPDGQKMVGNISAAMIASAPLDRLTDVKVLRYGRPSLSRLLPRLLPDGSILIVGRDMQDQREIEELVWHALLAGGAVALLLAIGGAFLFRRQLEHRVGAIRRTAREIEAGDLTRRIPISGVDDEFARLNRDINAMLDRIEHLMNGVRHVSNAIAHDLRTPLGRIRSRLEEALRPGSTAKLPEAGGFAIQQVDELIQMLDTLLQIAEAESGACRQSFTLVPLSEVVSDVVELYDAAAEEAGIKLASEIGGDPLTLGDKNLLTSAVANLVDNALKYAGGGATVLVCAAAWERDTVSVFVRDNGPGIPVAERPRVVERFYRLDSSRTLPGNGLGLSIVTAIASLHRGNLCLEDGDPGLIGRLILPRAEPAVSKRENVSEWMSAETEVSAG